MTSWVSFWVGFYRVLHFLYTVTLAGGCVYIICISSNVSNAYLRFAAFFVLVLIAVSLLTSAGNILKTGYTVGTTPTNRKLEQQKENG